MIYSCFGGTHTSPVAAALHLGLLPRGRPFTLEALEALPPFDRLTLRDLGRLLVWGRDAHGLQVATIGHGGWLNPIRTAVSATLAATGTPPGQVHWVDCYDLLTPSLRLGGFLSRSLGLSRAGRFLLLRGLEQIRVPLERRVEAVLQQLSHARPG